MNSRLDWLVLSDYYSIYVTNAPPIKRLSYNRQSFILRRNEIGTHFCDSKMRSRTNAKRYA